MPQQGIGFLGQLHVDHEVLDHHPASYFPANLPYRPRIVAMLYCDDAVKLGRPILPVCGLPVPINNFMNSPGSTRLFVVILKKCLR
jgi:hypothetical protein